MDLSSGRFLVTEVEGDEALSAELQRLSPAELLLPEDASITTGRPCCNQTPRNLAIR